MVGFLYLILAISFGCILIKRVCNVKKMYSAINSKLVDLPEILFILPAGATVGILLVAFLNYYLIYALNMFLNIPLNKIYMISIIIVSILLMIALAVNFKHTKRIEKIDKYYLKVILFLIIMACFLIFYGYFMRGSYLHLGPTIHSDLSPHTALVESFGNGANIPTMYSHFSNDGIRYHFFFYFFAGILKYLGMRLDFALNIPTIIGIVSALMLAGLFANLLSSSKKAYFWAPTLILFRSSFAIFDMIKGQSLLTFVSRVIHNTDWYHTTPYDEWGLWAINVYANQRHLIFGFAILLTIVMLFIPYVKKTVANLKKCSFKKGLHYLFLDLGSWKIQDFKLLVLVSLIIIALPYFHATVLITLLLILFVMAMFSENKLSYLIIAILAILSSYFQTAFFAGKVAGVVSFKPVFGFVMETTSIVIIIKYLIVLTGLTLILGWLYVFKKRDYLLILGIAFFAPVIFANVCQLSVDLLANHKFIQLTINLFSIFVGAFLGEYSLKKKTYFRQIVLIIMIFLLTATGISEWFIYINMNKYTSAFNELSDVTLWLKNNTEPTDTLLTPYWPMHSEYLSGRQIYYGWPYYAWSAGHNTAERSKKYFYLLRGCDDNIEKFIKLCQEEKIKYFIDTEEYYDFDDIGYEDYHREYITSNLKLVQEFPQEGTRIYQIY